MTVHFVVTPLHNKIQITPHIIQSLNRILSSEAINIMCIRTA
jgi:hypothetical protein